MLARCMSSSALNTTTNLTFQPPHVNGYSISLQVWYFAVSFQHCILYLFTICKFEVTNSCICSSLCMFSSNFSNQYMNMSLDAYLLIDFPNSQRLPYATMSLHLTPQGIFRRGTRFIQELLSLVNHYWLTRYRHHTGTESLCLGINNCYSLRLGMFVALVI